MTPIESFAWTFIYMGMFVGLFSIAVVVWAIWFEHNNKE